mmetsp:Transcript_29357/g.77593  ORF Transcript_29357/g.77593 Transcript_29357/m.77593 type:complete len:236 (+) Transcript_29357:1073-1780(+)
MGLQRIPCLVGLCCLLFAEAREHHLQSFVVLFEGAPLLPTFLKSQRDVLFGALKLLTHLSFQILEEVTHGVHCILRFYLDRRRHDCELVCDLALQKFLAGLALCVRHLQGPIQTVEMVLQILHVVRKVLDFLQTRGMHSLSALQTRKPTAGNLQGRVSIGELLRGELTFCFKAVLTRVGFRLHQDLQIVGKGIRGVNSSTKILSFLACKRHFLELLLQVFQLLGHAVHSHLGRHL